MDNAKGALYEQAPREWLVEHTKQADEAHDFLSALAVPECVHDGEHECDSLTDRIQWMAEGGGETMQLLAEAKQEIERLTSYADNETNKLRDALRLLDETSDVLRRQTAEIERLRAALKEAIDYMPSGYTDCAGYKCRQPNCVACFGEDYAEDGDERKANLRAVLDGTPSLAEPIGSGNRTTGESQETVGDPNGRTTFVEVPVVIRVTHDGELPVANAVMWLDELVGRATGIRNPEVGAPPRMLTYSLVVQEVKPGKVVAS